MAGPKFIEDDFTSVFDSTGEFSETVFINYNDELYETSGIFDETYIEFAADDTPIQSKYSRVTFDDNTITDLVGEEIKDSENSDLWLSIRNTIFRGYQFERDGTGLLMMNLKKSQLPPKPSPP